jgi:hypothetical protein
MVPVLSKTTVFILCNFCKLSAFLIKIPYCAPFPTQTIIPVGVANHKAHGHAITSTPIAVINAVGKLPITNRTINAVSAITRTIGTKIAATLSTSF